MQKFFCGLTALVHRQPAQELADGRNAARAHGKLIHAHTDKGRGQLRVASRLAAHAAGNVPLCSGLRRHGDEPQHGRMLRRIEVCHSGVAALDEIPDILARTFTCEGSAVIGGETIQCNGVHGTLNFEEALAHSCNVVFGEIAAELGPKMLMRYAEQVGVTRRYSFDGTTTAAGSFDVSNAAESELAWAGIGQYTDQINPCQYMTYMGAIANGGSAAEPFLVKEVTYGDSVKYKASTSSTGRLPHPATG